MTKNKESRMEKVAQYNCERIAIYSGTTVKGVIKTLSIYHDSAKDRWAIQVGNGKLNPCADMSRHYEVYGFSIFGAKPQGWSKV